MWSLDLSLPGVAVDVPLSNMALQYTSRQLLSLKQNYYLAKDVYDCCGNAGILSPKRYVHRLRMQLRFFFVSLPFDS